MRCPAFTRAENSHTGRHLTEFTSIDVESAFMDYTDVMDVLEALVARVCGRRRRGVHRGAGDHRPHGGGAGPAVRRGDIPDGPEGAAEEGVSLEFGDDLQDAHLRILAGGTRDSSS